MNAGKSTEPVEHTSKQVATSSNHHEERTEEAFYPPESKPVELLLSKVHWFQGEKLCLRRKGEFDNETIPKKKKHSPSQIEAAKKAAENADPISYVNINHVLDNKVAFDKEMTALLNEIQLSNEELMGRYKVICPHLNEIFRPTFPECQIFSFGSTVAELSFKECDLDIYMYLGRVGLPPIFNQPNVPQQMITAMIFKKVRKVMYSLRYIFTDIIAIPKAKTPIIKFRYLPTNVCCDISFKNGLGVYKSHFLKYCATHEPRLKPLMLLIKYWAKHLGISGGGRISNYGLVCLVIFYFQNVNLLPPLLELQKNCRPVVINGWQVNFNENTPIPPTTNNCSIPQLLHDFFSFYAEFTFNSFVLCLLDGKIYRAIEFGQVHNLPNYMNRYKSYVLENNARKLDVNRPMCVQDPFELDQNTTAITSERVLVAFQRCCMFSLDVCNAVREKNYDNLLKTLFGTVPPNMVPPKKKKKVYKGVITVGRSIKAGLPEDFEQRTDIVDKDQYIRENWYHVVFNLIKDIYEKVFKLQVNVFLDLETKQKQIEPLSHMHIRNNQTITFHCAGNQCVWKNRKKNNKTLLDVQLSALEKEAIVSDKVLEQLSKQNNDGAQLLSFICALEKKVDPVAVAITMHDESADKSVYRQFECFADSMTSKIIEKTLLHMLQFQKTYSQLLQNKQP
ncbi:PREDICTED: poly(A) RNA polymerase protein cid1-like isoform X2 [Dinoponera quadriceps]|uniref:Poly(A) RNA polymerase protein cid1-like isoform X2 n=1 Tax=Dinoponera quadriceps TaxID=609295 RepID=A0A6P3XJB4_DINQU|nr:PREDICTED: poly(A) RNA polymerase protein cid1-like isoform X2 [Dinoponera quadriceps]